MSNLKEDKVEYLTIIGNGFDLTCKLRTSYEDFFFQRYNDKIVSLFRNRIFDGISIDAVSDYGIMDFVLLANSNIGLGDILWSNVESEILNMNELDNVYGLNSLAEHYIDIFINQDTTKRELKTDEDHEFFLNRTRILTCLIKKNILPDPKTSIFREKYTVDNVVERLESTLSDSISSIEKSFKEYLLKSVTQNDKYEKNAIKVFEEILNINIGLGSYKQNYLINFNYTSPLKNEFYEYNNIHGNFEGESEIIFGIDEEKINVISPFYKLTKTYRKILLDSSKKKYVKKLPLKIKSINFFGHSLSEADYSYFQSIFDFYNIYDCGVTLIFYFVEYREGVLEETISQVSKLIKKYGETLDNPDHGKNLLHKLSLEGRLQVKELNVDYCNEEKQILKIN